MKISINANSFEIKSAITVKQIEALTKANPDALRVMDANSENELFRISYNEGKPSLASWGITFSTASRDENGYAVFTAALPASAKTNEAAKEYVADQISGAYAYLEQLEESVPAAATKVAEDRKSLLGAISIC